MGQGFFMGSAQHFGRPPGHKILPVYKNSYLYIAL